MLWGEDARPGKERLAYVAASHGDPGLLNWYPSIGSADADRLPGLGTIWPRSRDLERNNGYGAGAIQTYKDNIVGHQLRLNGHPDALLLGWKHEEAKQWMLFADARLGAWANDPGEVDAARSMKLLGLTIQTLGGRFSSSTGTRSRSRTGCRVPKAGFDQGQPLPRADSGALR
jgi:capsid protein